MFYLMAGAGITDPVCVQVPLEVDERQDVRLEREDAATRAQLREQHRPRASARANVHDHIPGQSEVPHGEVTCKQLFTSGRA